MNTAIWWIGVIHIAVYAMFGTAALIWFCTAKAAELTGNSRIIVQWYVDRSRTRKASHRSRI